MTAPFGTRNVEAAVRDIYTDYLDKYDSEEVLVITGVPTSTDTFCDTFQNVIDVGTKPETEIELEAPFVEWSKTEIADVGWRSGYRMR